MKVNPFPTTTYISPEYFCDRQSETKTLISNIENGLSTTLTAMRRMGKTGLILHVLNKLPKQYISVYTDILATNSKQEFLDILSTAIINAVPEKSSMGKKIWDFIRSLRPKLSFDPISGQPQVFLNGHSENTDHNFLSIIQFLESLPNRIVIAIDEFQQILEYPEKNIDTWLRTAIQRLNNVVFIFSGSQKHLMTDIFANPKRPFYRSTQMLHFDAIPVDLYKAFIKKKFGESGKIINDELVSQILDWTNVHTYYVQLLCNRIFSNSSKKITSNHIRDEINKLLNEQEVVFFQYRELLTKPQWNLLKATGKEDRISSPTSMGFINKHHLGSPATVSRSLKALLDKEMMYQDLGENSNKTYFVYDLLLRRWIQWKY